MTGKKYKEIKKRFYGFDYLRKMGEQGKLVNEIYCFPEFAGYHHSWLGDEDFINRKLHSYAHIKEHEGRNTKEFIHKCITEGKSLFPGHTMEIRHDIRDMRFVEEHRSELVQYFIDGK